MEGIYIKQRFVQIWWHLILQLVKLFRSVLLAFFPCCSLMSHLHCIIISHCWCKITSILGWPQNHLLNIKTFKVFFFSSTSFLFAPSPLLHLTSPSLIQQSHEKPAIVLPKSWLQIVSSVVRTQRCRWREITLHPANAWWCRGPLVPPISSWMWWRRFDWAMLLEVQDLGQRVPSLLLPDLGAPGATVTDPAHGSTAMCLNPAHGTFEPDLSSSHLPVSPWGRDFTAGKAGFQQHSPKFGTG